MNCSALLTREKNPMSRLHLLVLIPCLILLTLTSACRKLPATERAESTAKGLSASPISGSVATAAPSGPEVVSHLPVSASVDDESSKTFLWKAQSTTATVFLLGSIHVARAGLYPLDPRIERAFDSADTLVLEVVLDAANRASAAQQLTRAGTYPPGDSLDRHLSPDLFREAMAQTRASLGNSTLSNKWEPWFLAEVLLTTELRKLGYDDDNGIDRYFQQRAEGKKRIIPLETIEEQVGLLDGMPPTLQSAMLGETLEELSQLGPTLEASFLAWKKGQSHELYQLLMKPLDRPQYALLKQRLFTDRNARMTRELERFLTGKGTWFVVVGSGHLIGETGVISLLTQRHYEVAQQ